MGGVGGGGGGGVIDEWVINGRMGKSGCMDEGMVRWVTGWMDG